MLELVTAILFAGAIGTVMLMTAFISAAVLWTQAKEWLAGDVEAFMWASAGLAGLLGSLAVILTVISVVLSY